MRCAEDKQSDLSGNQLQLDFIVNTCGRNIDISNRQIKTMLSTLASIMLQMNQNKHKIQPQAKTPMVESFKSSESKKENPMKVSQIQIDSKIRQLEERIRKMEDNIKQTVSNEKMKEYVVNKQIVDQKVQILQNKLSHVIDRIQELQQVSKKGEKMLSPSKNNEQKKEQKKDDSDQQEFNFNLKAAELKNWPQLQKYQSSLIVYKNTITNVTNSSIDIYSKLITHKKSVFAIKFNKIIEFSGFGVKDNYNNNIAILYNDGECYDENLRKKIQSFKQNTIVAIVIDRPACTIVFKVDNQQVFSCINIGLKDKTKQIYLNLELGAKGDSISVFQ